MRILLVDNYDSFTYNLLHRFRELDVGEVVVLRNDRIDLNSLPSYDRIVLSPGPGLPCEAGSMMEVIGLCRETTPILGVCLGHQALAEAFGASLENLSTVAHGKEHEITIDVQCPLFRGLPGSIRVGRYHSWVVQQGSLPSEIQVTATGPSGEVMALCHRTLPLYGVQFHPESVMTLTGIEMLRNWVTKC